MSAPLQHTPGPWQLVALGEANVYGVNRVVDGKDRWLISFRMNGELTTAQQMADVRLIAAAPRLLAALEHIRNCVRIDTASGQTFVQVHEGSATMADIDAAIAQARGQEGGAA